MTPLQLGILAVQGDFSSHECNLQKHGVQSRLIRKPRDIKDIHGLILPGGESSVIMKFLALEGLGTSIMELALSGTAILATCAGLIVLAKHVLPDEQHGLGLLDITVHRNGYGRQVHSAVTKIHGQNGFEDSEGIFIRAPKIVAVGKDIEILARLNGDPVLLRKDRILATCFHPELSTSHPLTRHFLELCERKRRDCQEQSTASVEQVS